MRTNSSIINSRKKSFIEQKLNKIPLEKLSKESGFSKRRPKKISAKEFLLGFFLMANNPGDKSYRNWASKIGLLIKDKVSKQALWKKMHEEQIVFLKKVLSVIMNDSIGQKKITEFNMFKDIIIEDSTHIRLNEKLYKEYPGNENQHKGKKKSIMKIQAAYNLTKRRFIRFAIMPFRSNDQGYSPKILQVVKKGDLLIRDLGYFVIKAFRDLNKEGVYFISRLWKGASILSKEEETVIDLAKMLKKRGQLDIEILLGKEEQLPVRLIALPVEEKTANERRRKAKLNRDKRCSPNREHLYLLGWELFITNVDAKRLSTESVAGLYFIRWRIETIFKSWKSCFRITDIPKDANKIRMESYIYCMLIFITLFQVQFYNYCLEIVKTKSRVISLMRFMQYVTSNMTLILHCNLINGLKDQNFLLGQIKYYCLYESRNDRINFSQKLLKLG